MTTVKLLLKNKKRTSERTLEGFSSIEYINGLHVSQFEVGMTHSDVSLQSQAYCQHYRT